MGVGLVAVAAIVASLAFVRQRPEARLLEPPAQPGRSPNGPDLDAIRGAGF